MKNLTDVLQTVTEYVAALEEENAKLKAERDALEAKRRTYGKLADLPDVLKVAEIAAFLRIDTNSVYTLFKKPLGAGGIPSFGGGERGGALRCMKQDLIDWLDSRRAGAPAAEDDEVPIRIIKGGRRMKF